MMRNFLKKNLKGIGLTEMLVVIAIIGILATIILVGVIGVKKEAKDARIVKEMDQLRGLAQFYRMDREDKSYTGLCTVVHNPSGDPEINALVSDIVAQGGSCGEPGMLGVCCYESGTDYCAKVKLNSGWWWCMDNTGTAKLYSTVSGCGHMFDFNYPSDDVPLHDCNNDGSPDNDPDDPSDNYRAYRCGNEIPLYVCP